MQRIDLSSVRGAEISGKEIRPQAITAVCPNCNEKGVFTLGGFQSAPLHSVIATGRCPGCRAIAAFWTINEKPERPSTVNSAVIYMTPAAERFYPAPDQSEAIPEALRRALVATIDSYNAGIYSAAAVSGRRTLEGIFKFLLPEEKRNQPLAKLIDATAETANLAAPLYALSHAIRSGGNLGAHFDIDKEPDQAVARQIVELLTYLITYLYVLPDKIRALERALGEDGDDTPPAE